MSQTADEIVRQMTLYSDDVRYVMVKLPAQAITAAAGVLAEISEPYSAVIVDKDEVTLIVTRDDLAEFGKRLPGHVVSEDEYRLITFDVVMDSALVGFMARVSAALADAGISIMPFAAYSHDHVLVPADRYARAIEALNTLKASVTR